MLLLLLLLFRYRSSTEGACPGSWWGVGCYHNSSPCFRALPRHGRKLLCIGRHFIAELYHRCDNTERCWYLWLGYSAGHSGCGSAVSRRRGCHLFHREVPSRLSSCTTDRMILCRCVMVSNIFSILFLTILMRQLDWNTYKWSEVCFSFSILFLLRTEISRQIGTAVVNLLNCYSSMRVYVVGFMFWCYNFTILLLPYLHLLDIIEEK